MPIGCKMVLIFFVLSQDDLKIANSEKMDIVRGVPSKHVLSSMQRIYLNISRNLFPPFYTNRADNTFIV